MNKLHCLAIELKFDGRTYEEISYALDGKLTAGTLKKYFAEDGMLTLDYHDYLIRQIEMRDEEARRLFKRTTVKAAKTIIGVLERAVATQNDRLILRTAGIILDRAGLAIDRHPKAVVEEPEEITMEELDKRLREQGIDPDSIKYIPRAPIGALPSPGSVYE